MKGAETSRGEALRNEGSNTELQEYKKERDRRKKLKMVNDKIEKREIRK